MKLLCRAGCGRAQPVPFSSIRFFIITLPHCDIINLLANIHTPNQLKIRPVWNFANGWVSNLGQEILNLDPAARVLRPRPPPSLRRKMSACR